MKNKLLLIISILLFIQSSAILFRRYFCDGEKIPPEYNCGAENIVAFGGGCKNSSRAYKIEETCDNPKIMSKFVVDCARAGNPMSDEEGEDLVEQCDKTAFRIFCKTKKIYYKE